MSNIQTGTEICSEDSDFKLMYHANSGHVIGWNRNYDFDGGATNTWDTTDYGTPREAAECYPGLAGKILEYGGSHDH